MCIYIYIVHCRNPFPVLFDKANGDGKSHEFPNSEKYDPHFWWMFSISWGQFAGGYFEDGILMGLGIAAGIFCGSPFLYFLWMSQKRPVTNMDPKSGSIVPALCDM